jgi:hypothetical protein
MVVMTRRARFLALFALVAALAGFAGAVLAAPSDDRAATESILADLEKDPHQKTLCADPIAQSRMALERARRMRVAGDAEHARLAEGLAFEWARVGQELARADAIETRAAAARASAADAGAAVERERATLEQQLAENGRLQAELAKIETRDAGPAISTTHTTHTTTLHPVRDGGAR